MKSDDSMFQIHKENNIFTDIQRKDLLNKSQPFIQFMPGFPARQTKADLHYSPSLRLYFQIIYEKIRRISNLNLEIVKAWVNEDCGRKEDIYYHNHPTADYSCVYYIKTLPYFNSGTLFKDYGFVRAKQNSLIIFPSNLVHGTPSYAFPFIKRYTLAIDLNIR